MQRTYKSWGNLSFLLRTIQASCGLDDDCKVVESLIDPKFEQRFPCLDKVGIEALRKQTVMATVTNIFCHSKDVKSCGKVVGKACKTAYHSGCHP